MESTFGRGKVPTELDLFEWAKEVEKRGAGEILFTSMDHDGTKNGFANQALAKLSELVNIPVIASGGAGPFHTLRTLSKMGKLMLLWLPVFFILRKSKSIRSNKN